MSQPTKNLSNSSLVYSTDGGRMCPKCAQPTGSCVCAQAALPSATDGIVRVSRETKGRAGKGVTLVKGLALSAISLTQMAKELRAACGSGGTIKEGVIVVQGDHREKVANWLQERGHKVKLIGA